MKQVAVIGLGRFGMSVAESLSENRCQVLAIDNDMVKVKQAQTFVTQAVQLDAREADALKAVGVAEMDQAVVAIGSMLESSMLATMVLKEIGVKYVVAKAVTKLHGRFLEKVGADSVVYPEMDSGRQLGRHLAKPNILEQVEFGADHGVFEIVAPETWVGKTLAELSVRGKYGVSVLAIKTAPENAGSGVTYEMNISPLATTVISGKDILLVLGHGDDVEKIAK
ncbi:MAG: TrkA family potassium uptake protein [bacterium]|nr:TrkA family potassium uptake protein [bacterium]MDT8395675.1 TrkA family potassium uptake protein [bacterium]